MDAISSRPSVIVTQNSNTLPVGELRAAPQQENPVNNQDNSVSASQSTQLANNQQAPQPEQPTQAVSQTEQQLQRAAVEASATAPQPQAAPPENRDTNQQANVETRQTENRQQVANDNTVETPAPPPAESQTSTLANNTAAVSTYQQVGNLGSEQPRRTETGSSDTSSSTASSPDQPTSQTTSTSSSTSDTQEASPERQVFGGAIDAPRQQAG